MRRPSSVISEPAKGAEAALWAASGAMALTGRATGPPQVGVGSPTTMLRDTLLLLADQAEGLVAEPDVRLLGERAAIAGLRRRGPASCGGGFRLLPSADGFLGLSLPRPEDVELLPALVEGRSPARGDPWRTVAAWAREVPTDEAVARCRLFALAAAAVRSPDPRPSTRPPVVSRMGGHRMQRRSRPRVVDLSGLWAGPLCAHLLGLTGADVIKVESITRPDGARRGPQPFFDLMHHGHDSVVVDLQDSDDVGHLAALMHSADLVIESSRARALAQIGLLADEFVNAGVAWLSITARGRDSETIGFGDDVAADAGLLAWDDDGPVPAGDAIADPLTGVVAAAAALEALEVERAQLLDVSMLAVAAEAAAGAAQEHEVRRDGDAWIVETAEGVWPVAAPHARHPAGSAAVLGAHTRDHLR